MRSSLKVVKLSYIKNYLRKIDIKKVIKTEYGTALTSLFWGHKVINFKKFFRTLVSHTLHTGTGTTSNICMLLTIEGVLFSVVTNLINNNNLLFALRLGANDTQIGLLSSLPQFVGMIFLIPAGILTDRLRNKSSVVILSLLLLDLAYLASSFVPVLSAYRFYAFLILISISMAPFTIYNTSWQAYFSDITPIEERNTILTSRNKWTFLVGIFVPLISGNLLASANSTSEKIMIHQLYFWIVCVILILQIYVLTRVKSDREGTSTKLNLHDLKKILFEIINNKKFLVFVSIAMFFYISWQFDWTLYFIGQVRYLKMNEAWLSYVLIGGALVQFATIGFWSTVNEKYGVRFGIIAGNIGVAVCPIIMIVSTSVPSSIGPVVFLILNIIANITCATIPLNMLQCLLQVIPQKIKTLSISIYTLFITLSNAIMPMAGIGLYTWLGGDLQALQKTFLIIFILRVISVGLWTLRWYSMRNEEK